MGYTWFEVVERRVCPNCGGDIKRTPYMNAHMARVGGLGQKHLPNNETGPVGGRPAARLRTDALDGR